jgi:hypothetical protein
MKIVQALCGVALAPHVHQVATAANFDAGGDDPASMARALGRRLRDLGQPLADALQRSIERGWLALEIALDGPAWNQRLPGLEGPALAAQLRAFLETEPMPELDGKTRFRQLALAELREARRGGKLIPGPLALDHITALSGTLVRFTDPQAISDGDRLLMKLLSEEVKQAGFGNLAWLLTQRVSQADPVLPAAVRSYFRHEIEDNDHFFRAFRPQGRQGLNEAREAGFAALSEAIAQQGPRLASLLDEPPDIGAPGPAAVIAAPAAVSAPPRAVAAAEPEPLDVIPVEPVLDVVPVEEPPARGAYRLADEDEDEPRGRRGRDRDESPRKRRERAEPEHAAFHPVDFQASVVEDSKEELAGNLQARVKPGALFLFMGEETLEVPVGTKASADGRELELTLGKRSLVLTVSAGRNSQQLAEDIAAYLNKDKELLDHRDYLFPNFLFPVIVTLVAVLIFLLMITARIIYAVRQPASPPAQKTEATPGGWERTGGALAQGPRAARPVYFVATARGPARVAARGRVRRAAGVGRSRKRAGP